MISNHVVVFLAVGVTRWPVLRSPQGICFGPHGQGDGLDRVQPGRPAPDVQQLQRPQPPLFVQGGGKVVTWARLRSEHQGAP